MRKVDAAPQHERQPQSSVLKCAALPRAGRRGLERNRVGQLEHEPVGVLSRAYGHDIDELDDGPNSDAAAAIMQARDKISAAHRLPGADLVGA